MSDARILSFEKLEFFPHEPAGGWPAFNSLSLSFGGEDIVNEKKINS